MDMSPLGRFAYSGTEMYFNNKAFLMTGRSLKWFCAILNSSLVTWMISRTARTTGAGLTQWEKFVVETIPIPSVPKIQKQPVIRTVDRILNAMQANSIADMSELQIDWII